MLNENRNTTATSLRQLPRNHAKTVTSAVHQISATYFAMLTQPPEPLRY
jgi:hypothetical protein